MFAVTVELLAGRYVATQFNDRSAFEWPPHPARLFSAAVAAWADHGDEDPREREALEWWEALPAPSIECSLGREELVERAPVTHFVPVNDTSVVARVTARTYLELVDAESAAADPELDEKASTKAGHRLEKARAKAADDSRKATEGVAPGDRLEILPGRRGKQARMFPTVIPRDPVVTYLWTPEPNDDPETVREHLDVLDGLLARVPRVGHSSSPVSVSLTPDVDAAAVEVSLEPGAARRSLSLRVTSEGQLENLIAAYVGSDRGTEPRTMPARMQAYRRPGDTVDPPPSSIGENWILLEPETDSRLGIRDVAGVARTLRAALMSVAGEGGAPVPEAISGHRPRVDGEVGPTAPSDKPHLMVLGLPFAGRRHGTGELMALAVVLPQPGPGEPVDPDGWAVLSSTVRRFFDEQRGAKAGRLTFSGGRRPVRLRLASLDGLSESARVERWSAPSATWTSVTPVALHRNPGKLGHPDPAKREAAVAAAEATIADACEQIGLPRPVDVSITLDAPTKGTRPVHAFPPAHIGALTRVQVHAHLRFAEPVRGPIVIGAGRFQGIGLFTQSDDELLPPSTATTAGPTRAAEVAS